MQIWTLLISPKHPANIYQRVKYQPQDPKPLPVAALRAPWLDNTLTVDNPPYMRRRMYTAAALHVHCGAAVACRASLNYGANRALLCDPHIFWTLNGSQLSMFWSQLSISLLVVLSWQSDGGLETFYMKIWEYEVKKYMDS